MWPRLIIINILVLSLSHLHLWKTVRLVFKNNVFYAFPTVITDVKEIVNFKRAIKMETGLNGLHFIKKLLLNYLSVSIFCAHYRISSRNEIGLALQSSAHYARWASADWQTSYTWSKLAWLPFRLYLGSEIHIWTTG